MTAIRVHLAAACCILGFGIAAAANPTSPAKMVKAAESKLKRLLKEGDDRPSVYEARFELVQALRALDSCDVKQQIDGELQSVTAWLERTEVPVRLTRQHVYNEVGRVAQSFAQCAQDEAGQRALHENALQAFARARAAAKSDYDAMNEAVVLYNAAQSAEAIDDLPRAIALMEEAVAIDREYALYDNYKEDYVELVRMRDAHSGVETPPESVQQHLDSLERDKVRFTFKPAHGDQQRYKSSLRQLTVTNGQRREHNLEMQYAVAVSLKDDLVTMTMQPGESRINGRDAKAVANGTSGASPEELVARLLNQPFSYVVKSSGEFVGATGLDESRRLVLQTIDQTLSGPNAAEQRDHARKLIEQVLSDAVINQQIASEWNMSTGWWVDAELDLGDWYSSEIDAPQAVLANETLKYTYTFKVNRRLSCGPTDAKKSCVELILETSPDREQFADHLVAMMRKLGSGQSRKELKSLRERTAQDLHMVERNIVVLDPNTLKTYKQLKTKVTYMPSSGGGQPKLELRTAMAELEQPARNTKPATAQTKPKQAKPARGGSPAAKRTQ